MYSGVDIFVFIASGYNWQCILMGKMCYLRKIMGNDHGGIRNLNFLPRNILRMLTGMGVVSVIKHAQYSEYLL